MPTSKDKQTEFLAQWVRQPNGSYVAEDGVPFSNRSFRIDIKRGDEWIEGMSHYPRAEAKEIIVSAIAKGLVTAEAYRITPVKNEPMSEETKQRLRDLHESSRRSKHPIEVDNTFEANEAQVSEEGDPETFSSIGPLADN